MKAGVSRNRVVLSILFGGKRVLDLLRTAHTPLFAVDR